MKGKYDFDRIREQINTNKYLVLKKIKSLQTEILESKENDTIKENLKKFEAKCNEFSLRINNLPGIPNQKE